MSHKPTFTLKSQLIHVKDRITTLKDSCAVYELGCNSCPKVYIGETGRNVQTRMEEHRKDITKKKDVSLVYQHHKETKHSFDFDNVKILHKSTNFRTRRILESYYTHAETNSINRAYDVNQTFTPIIDKFLN